MSETDDHNHEERKRQRKQGVNPGTFFLHTSSKIGRKAPSLTSWSRLRGSRRFSIFRLDCRFLMVLARESATIKRPFVPSCLSRKRRRSYHMRVLASSCSCASCHSHISNFKIPSALSSRVFPIWSSSFVAVALYCNKSSFEYGCPYSPHLWTHV